VVGATAKEDAFLRCSFQVTDCIFGGVDMCGSCFSIVLRNDVGDGSQVWPGLPR